MENEKMAQLPLIDSDLRLNDKNLTEKEIENLKVKREEIHNYLRNIDNEILIHYFYDFFERYKPEFKKYIEQLTFSIDEIEGEIKILIFECDYTEAGFQANINIEDALESFFFQYIGNEEKEFLNKISFINFKSIDDKSYISKLYSGLDENYLKKKEFKKIKHIFP